LIVSGMVFVFDERSLDSFDDGHLSFQIGSLVKVNLTRAASGCERRL